MIIMTIMSSFVTRLYKLERILLSHFSVKTPERQQPLFIELETEMEVRAYYEQPAHKHLVSQFATKYFLDEKISKNASFRRDGKRKSMVEASGRNLSQP